MSLITILKTIGKDLKDVAGWIEDGLKIAQAPVEAVDPAITPIYSALEALLEKLAPTQTTSATVQGITTALAAVPASLLPGLVKALESIITAASAPAAPASSSS
jgi:hypothetical protein